MKAKYIVALLTVTMISAVTAASNPPTLAVLGIESTKDLESEASKAAVLLGVHLSNDDKLMLVERAEVDKLLSEQELGLTGAMAPEAATKVGHMLGAQVLISGRLVDVGGKRMAVSKLMGVETSRTVSLSTEYADEVGLNEAMKTLAEQISKKLREQMGAFVAEDETMDQVLVRLKKQLPADRPLPSVYVHIPEQHLTTVVPDPAAATEVQNVLQRLGFKLADIGSADYRIEGEAFSERAGQRGQLICCKASVELKVTSAKKDQVWAERQTTAAIDLAEHVAAKTALQNAGRDLADRLVMDFFSPRLK